ncbi:hypothetical protein [Streptomyces sp. NPDC052179]|uniref:hypothetical protein n=1 Tax=Streptomyces sp. NPDC052179 TaxID=3155680 RepID=UPI00343675A5
MNDDEKTLRDRLRRLIDGAPVEEQPEQPPLIQVHVIPEPAATAAVPDDDEDQDDEDDQEQPEKRPWHYVLPGPFGTRSTPAPEPTPQETLAAAPGIHVTVNQPPSQPPWAPPADPAAERAAERLHRRRIWLVYHGGCATVGWYTGLCDLVRGLLADAGPAAPVVGIVMGLVTHIMASYLPGLPYMRWIGLLITAVVSKTLPYTTNITIGLTAAWVLTALVLGYAATMPPKDDEKKKEQPTEDDPKQPEKLPHPSENMTREHVTLLLHTLYTEGSGVHLAALAAHLHGTAFMGHPAAPWETRDVRALLTRHEVRIRPGVRVPPVGGREGVHRDDFPPLPQPPSRPAVVGVVVPGQRNNNNANNGPSYPFEVVDDPTNPARARVRFPGL